MEILIVISVEHCLDKNKKAYTKLKLTTPPYKVIEIEGVPQRVFVKPKVTTLIAYPISYLPSGAPEFGHDLKLGDKVAGKIVTRVVAPYDINGRQVDTASVVVAGDTTDQEEFEIEIKRAFKRNGFTLLTKELHAQLSGDRNYVVQKPNEAAQYPAVPEDCIPHN